MVENYGYELSQNSLQKAVQQLKDIQIWTQIQSYIFVPHSVGGVANAFIASKVADFQWIFNWAKVKEL